MSYLKMISFAVFNLVFTCVPLASVQAEEVKLKPITVPKILKVAHQIQKSAPPNLILNVVGEVPTGGYTKTKLSRVVYKKPPKDGIQDYKLTAVPPSGIAIQAISQVTASNTWKGYPNWVKGIRVHGVKSGTVLIKFDQGGDTIQPVRRRFKGTSKDGSFEKALTDAITKLNQALSAGGVNDASATWKVVKTSGQVGGIAGQNQLSVVISAERQPPWPQKKKSKKQPQKKK
ncbi:hypothetical protein [Gimesia aquarii]|uniref:Uncharacterized protein n=1 Tax=Gimesia aquarii TaxID=2527964 RepID=A0A517W4K3_9PLAN|nr:hypothetical protein [Gimesia aquarii]QDU00171.1 hypothetical protein V144x_56840 [Gimesia aquarii]